MGPDGGPHGPGRAPRASGSRAGAARALFRRSASADGAGMSPDGAGMSADGTAMDAPGAGLGAIPDRPGPRDATRGRLFGRNVLEAVFRAAPDEDLFLGELLVGVDEGTGRRYLFRVVDVTYGSEHREPGWAERVAG